MWPLNPYKEFTALVQPMQFDKEKYFFHYFSLLWFNAMVPAICNAQNAACICVADFQVTHSKTHQHPTSVLQILAHRLRQCLRWFTCMIHISGLSVMIRRFSRWGFKHTSFTHLIPTWRHCPETLIAFLLWLFASLKMGLVVDVFQVHDK